MTDSEPRTISFPPLNDDNYHYWVLRMEAELVRRGLYGACIRGWLDDGIEWTEEMKVQDPTGWAKRLESWEKKRTNKKRMDARAEIVARISDSQLDHVLGLGDPVDIWQTLQRVHVSRGLASRLSLRREFLKLMKKDDETMSGFIGRVRKLAYRLKMIGVDVTDEDMILAATVGLGDSWSGLVMTLDSTPAGELTFEYVVGRLLNEEAKRKSETPGVKDDSGLQAKDKAYVAKGQGQDRTCWQCGQTGHVKAFCKTEPTDKGKQKEGQGSGEKALVARTSGIEVSGLFALDRMAGELR